MAEVNKSTNYGVLLEDAGADAAVKDLRKYQEMADKLIAAYPFVNRPMLIAQNIANAIKTQAEAEAKANAAKTQANAYDPYSRLNNNVQYVMNTLKTYGYPQQVLDSFKQDIDKILANTKDNNRIDTANQYIDQFLGDKSLALQDLRRLDPVPGKPALDQQPQKAGNKNNSGGTQGVQGVQAGTKTGNAVAGGGVQGSNNGSGKKPRMSDAEIDAFLNDELGGDTTGNGTYASPGVPKGGTKTIGYGYDPNPGNVSLAYAMRNAPEQERRDALINEWNRENGRLNRSSGTYASPGISSGGTYATGEGIKDANGNVLTNPGGDWEYQYALRDPAYGLGMRDRMSDAQKNYWQAVAHDMGYNYDR